MIRTLLEPPSTLPQQFASAEHSMKRAQARFNGVSLLNAPITRGVELMLTRWLSTYLSAERAPHIYLISRVILLSTSWETLITFRSSKQGYILIKLVCSLVILWWSQGYPINIWNTCEPGRNSSAVLFICVSYLTNRLAYVWLRSALTMVGVFLNSQYAVEEVPYTKPWK